jgi:ABC-type multidrug transport system fused ATPase/permease subunit
MQTYSKIISIIYNNGKMELYTVLALSIMTAFVDLASIVSIVPFMTLLAQLGNDVDHPMLIRISGFTGLHETNEIAIFLLIVAFSTIVMANALKVILLLMQQWFVARINIKISKKMVLYYLDLPYIWHLNHNSSEVTKNILSEVDQVVGTGVYSLITIISAAISALFLLALLTYVDPIVSLFVGLVMVAIYGSITTVIKRQINRISQIRFDANNKRFQFLGELIAGIKSIKILKNSHWFLEKFNASVKLFVSLQAKATITKILPRYILEALGIGVVLSIIAKMIIDGHMLSEIIPTVSIYAFTGYKLIPYFQAIYSANVAIQFASASVNPVHNNLNIVSEMERKPNVKDEADLSFIREICVHDLSFSYDDALKPTLKNINVTIPKGSWFGIVGRTGCGKSTLIDCLVGLLEPHKGTVFIDDTKISTETLPAWHKKIAFTHQQSFIFDDTIKNNIVFGAPDIDIDETFLHKVVMASELSDLHESGIKAVLDIVAGERGMKLSGGQLQRVGIGRSLYRNVDVLIIDESTSALDTITEKKLMANIKTYFPNITIIAISHNLNLMKDFDHIAVMDDGAIADMGTYAELISRNTYFKDLALKENLS